MTSPGRSIVVGIGAGIAAYKTATVVSRLAQAGPQVRVVMTRGAEEFIGHATLAALSGHPVMSDAFDSSAWPLGAHIAACEGADLLVVAPATANLIAKFAHGIADDLLSTVWLQCDCPQLIAPAMSNLMWQKPAVQRNVATLQDDGVEMVGPEAGWLSCRRQGIGRMSEAEAIVAAATTHLNQQR